ncbi:winged helix-turn-helix domain-containing protein [Kitasatospora sp. NPDC089797]|uniref:ArsR/SmtB family transcription factor n=1 Tax=Kitasatospora sp. NPDC089797 TaxID=3155298 RepID=UPI00342954B2
MLDLRFTVSDLARTRFTISPMDQILGGTAGAGHHCVGPSGARDRWWRRVRQRVPYQATPFLELVNASLRAVPDFLAVDADAGRRTLTDELDALLAVTDGTLRQDLAFHGDGRELAPIVRDLREGGARPLRRVADGVWALFRSCLAPDWPDIQRVLRADIAQHARSAAEAGPGAMLGALHAQALWRPEGVLRIPVQAADEEFDLGGRGLELRPNFFLTGVAAGLEGRQPPVLLYPVCVPHPDPAAVRRVDGLALLIGGTRARALRSIGRGPCTTTLLSDRIGLSPATASAHATVLRAAGAITTERAGTEVRHALTQLGRDLLLHNPEPAVRS